MAGLAGLQHAIRRPRLNVFNWSSYIAPDTDSGLRSEFGVRVRYAIYESNEEMLAKVMTGNSGWDIVFPTHSRIQPMLRNGLLAPLRSRVASQPRSIWTPRFRTSGLGPGSGLLRAVHVERHGHRLQHVGCSRRRRAGPTCGTPHLRGRMTMLDDPEDVLGACLKKLGCPFNSTDAGATATRAKHEAIEQKKLLRAYLNAEVRDQLVSGDVLMAQLWSTTAQQAIDAAPAAEIRLSARRGFRCTATAPSILRESRRTELAHQFLDYLLRPDVTAPHCGVHPNCHGQRRGAQALSA